MHLRPLLLAFASSLVLTYLVRALSRRSGFLSNKRGQRWNQKSIPVSGGLAIFAAFLIGTSANIDGDLLSWGIVAGASIAFFLGLIDDFVTLSPGVKLLGQITAATVFVSTGTMTAFFEASILNLLISIFWLVAMSNALNLLDNMDGLSTATTVIAAGFLAYFFFQAGNNALLPLALAMAGASLGFLVFNFPPASIFMGDSGSLFLGITLAGLAIAKEPQASNILAVMAVPLLILMLPILDTAMVSITRILRGQSPAVGGRDHISHRLVSLGLSERQVVLLLAGISVVSGLLAVVLEDISYTLSLLLIPLVIIVLTLFTAYLGQINLDKGANKGQVFSSLLAVSDATSRLHFIEIGLDVLILTVSYYAAFVVRFGAPLSPLNTQLFASSVPIILISGLFAFIVLRIYRTVWKYISVADVIRIGQAALLTSVAAAFVIVLVFRFEDFSRQVFLIFPVLLFLLTVLSRFSFRIIDSALDSAQTSNAIPVLIYGAGSAGEFAIREFQRNKELGYTAVGFIDDKKSLAGRRIHGIPVLGTVEELERIVRETNAQGLVISSREISSEDVEQFKSINNAFPKFWKKRLLIDFEDI